MPNSLAALDAWFEVQHRRRWGLSGADEYRGIRPGLKLVITHKGQAFELAFKHRQLGRGPEVYRTCDALQQTISRHKAGITAQRAALVGGNGLGRKRRR